MIKNIKITFILLCACFKISAQTDTLKISNVSIIPEISLTADTLPSPTFNDTVRYKILFKLSNVTNADKIFIKIGSTMDDGQFLSIELTKSTMGNNHYFNWNGQQYKVWGNRGYCLIDLVRPPNTVKWLSIYAIDLNGISSTHTHINF